MDSRCYVIAEAGVNHNGSLAVAKNMVEVAKECGADAVKFQTFRAESLATAAAPKAAYQTLADSGQSQLEMLRELELSETDFTELFRHAQDLGIEFLSTPFDIQSADFLAELGMARFKIPSGEITNIRLLRHIASLGKSVILSTGMSDLSEVAQALEWLEGSGDAWLLQCVSAYPASPEDMNLRAMATMKDRFGFEVGLSDHTVGLAIPLAAVALGAIAIEKHFTLDRSMSGPDHAMSLEPPDLRRMIEGIRDVEAALGSGIKQPTAPEREIAIVARRSLVASRDLQRGAVLVDEDIDLKRPGTGIEPRRISDILGRTLLVDVSKDTLLGWSMLA